MPASRELLDVRIACLRGRRARRCRARCPRRRRRGSRASAFIAPGMERGDLVVVEVGDDERLRGERAAASCARRRCAMPSASSRSRYARAVVAERRHHDRLAAERLQVVRDVARAAAPFAAHLADLERHRQHVRLVGQDVAREAVGEHHDGVEGERAADQRALGTSGGVAEGVEGRGSLATTGCGRCRSGAGCADRFAAASPPR